MLKLSGYPRLTWGRFEGRISGGSTDGPPGSFLRVPSAARATGHRVIDDHRMSRQTKPGTQFWANRTACVREAIFRPTPPAAGKHRGGVGATMRDAQADVPSAERLRAQLAFKDSMVHGILQFTPSIAFRYVLHRCESRDIRCRESLRRSIKLATFSRFLGAYRARVLVCSRGAPTRGGSRVPKGPETRPEFDRSTRSQVVLLGRLRQ